MNSNRQTLMKDETAVKGVVDRLRASLQERMGNRFKIDHIISLSPIMTEVGLVDPGDGRRLCARIYRALETNHDLVRQAWAKFAAPLAAAGAGMGQSSYGLQTVGHCIMHLADDVAGMDLETYLALTGPSRSEFALRTLVKVIDILEEMSEIDCRHYAITASQVILRKDGSVVLKNAGLAQFEAQVAKQLGVSELIDAAHAAPEQLAGRPPVAATEIYQLGLLLYRMVAGRVPYVGSFDEVKAGHLQKALPNPQTLNKSVGVGLTRVLMRALGKNPAQRFATLAEFKSALGFLHPAPERAAITIAESGHPTLGQKELAKIGKQLEEAKGYCAKKDFKTALRLVDSVLMLAGIHPPAIALHEQIWEAMYGGTVAKYLMQASSYLEQREPGSALAALNVALSLAPRLPRGLALQGGILESYRDRHIQFPAAIQTKAFLGQAVEAKTAGNLMLAEGLWMQVLLVPRRESEAEQNQLQFEKQLAARGLKGVMSGRADLGAGTSQELPVMTAPPAMPPPVPTAPMPQAEVASPPPLEPPPVADSIGSSSLLEAENEDFFGSQPKEENFFPEVDQTAPLEALSTAERTKKSKKVPLMLAAVALLVLLAVAGFLFWRYQAKAKYRKQAMVAYNRADDLEASGDWNEALAAWSRVVADYPDYLDPEVRKKTLEHKIDKRRQDIEDHMRDAQARFDEGLLIDETEDNAITHLRRILEVQPDHPEALALFETIRVAETAKAQEQWESNKIDEARATYGRLLDMNPDFKNPELEEKINAWVQSNVVAPALTKMDRALQRKRWDEAREIGDALVAQTKDPTLVQEKWNAVYADFEKQYNDAAAKEQTQQMLNALEVMASIKPDDLQLIERKDKLSRDLNLEKIESLEQQVQEAARKKQTDKTLGLAKQLQNLDSKNPVASKAVEDIAVTLHDKAETLRRTDPKAALSGYRDLLKIRNWRDYKNQADILEKRILNFDTQVSRFRKQVKQPPMERKQELDAILREFNDFTSDSTYKELQGMGSSLESEDQRLKKLLQWENQVRGDNGKTYAGILAQLNAEARFANPYCEQKRGELVSFYQNKVENYDGDVVLRVVSATNLPLDKRAETFCRVETGAETFETPAIKKDESPQWMQVFNFTAKPGKPLVFSILQKKGKKISLIGSITVAKLPESGKNITLKPNDGTWTLTIDIKRQR